MNATVPHHINCSFYKNGTNCKNGENPASYSDHCLLTSKQLIMQNDTFSDILLEPLYATQQINLGEFPKSPVEQVRKRARRQSVAGEGDVAPIFCELLELRYDGPDEILHWGEKARWIKFEETVEVIGKRWSKPHIPLITAPALFQVKNAIKRGAVLFDVSVERYTDLVDLVLKEWQDKRAIEPDEVQTIRNILTCNKSHLHKTALKQNLQVLLMKTPSIAQLQYAPEDGETADEIEQDHITREQIKKYLEHSEVATLLIGAARDIKHPVSAFVRLRSPKIFPNVSEKITYDTIYHIIDDSLKRLPIHDAKEKDMLNADWKVPRPNRFFFILLVPFNHPVSDLQIIGRCMGAMFIDPVFDQVAFFAQDVHELCYGVDHFLKDVIIIPPGKWRTDLMLEPNDKVNDSEREEVHTPLVPSKVSIDLEGLQYTGKLFGGLIDDIKRRMPYYISDFKDPFMNWRAFSQVLAATVFLFFANLTNVIAFGGVMDGLLEQRMGVIECIVASVISGILFGLFSGQPLCIMSTTGPVLIFEALFFEFCNESGWGNFLVARCWLLVWSAVILLILVALDASFLVAYITRFTEETFATLISLVFVVESIEAILKINAAHPLTRNPQAVLQSPCYCEWNETSFLYNETGFFNYTANITSRQLIDTNFTWNDCKNITFGTKHVPRFVGLQCNFKPDVFMFSVMIFVCSYLLATWLQSFKHSRFLTGKVREIISDFSLLLSIMLTTIFANIINLPGVPMLRVPASFTPTIKRNWIINPLAVDKWWIPVACFPAALLYVLLVVMDQQITTVILNRKENKLRKGFGYHLDLLLVVIILVISGILGVPCFLSATILSITHMHSLRMESENTAPGEKPIFLGVREQRVSPVLAHILMAFSIFMGSIEKYIPEPALLGVFLYMGVSCLLDQQFFQRILLFLTPIKHQPDFSYLRLIRMRRVHLFTLFQILALAALCIVNYVDVIEMLFPVMLVLLVVFRKMLSYIFTDREICILDDPLPPWKALKKSESGRDAVVTVEGVSAAFLRNFGLSSKETYIQ